MDCKHCVDNLTAYLDGELNPADFRIMEDHVGGCPACRGELESLRKASQLVESHIEEIEPRPEIWNGLLTRISDTPTPDRSLGFFRFFLTHRWSAATAALAACVVMAGGAWGIWNYRQSERTLRQYMENYVQIRTQQEEDRRASPDTYSGEAAISVEVHSEYTDNPFVDFDPQEVDNPFRSEEQ